MQPEMKLWLCHFLCPPDSYSAAMRRGLVMLSEAPSPFPDSTDSKVCVLRRLRSRSSAAWSTPR